MQGIIKSLSFAFVFLFSGETSACTFIPTPPIRTIYGDASLVFRGVAIKAEAIGPPYTVVKVWWQVDEVLKGRHIGEEATVSNLVCGGVVVIVGMPYVVAVEQANDEDQNGAKMVGIAGFLVDFGTKSAADDQYETLLDEYRLLSKQN